MKLYPPYKNWKTEIRNPDKFLQFLVENIETNNSKHSAPYKGKLSVNEFLVERKLVHYNTARPQIKGIIKISDNGKQIIVLTIESRKYLLYIVSVFAIIMSATAILRSNFLVLLGIPITAIWFYIVGLILHNIELKKTKVELNRIMEKAEII
ncbi:hypothetical protein [Aureibaculum luteum]|uniref:hypothetical protein n=1 Tax=Aureibaculum luteum TaxID=1548456 RepID=UPI000E4F7127|nr:hypothetical protein [Aureibaculum luteum]